MNNYILILMLTVLTLVLPGTAGADPEDKVGPDTRCPVCGMFVAKYDVWITQIRYDEENILNFDGVKDMMAYYFDPAAYAGKLLPTASEVWVKDYYSLKWTDGRKAFYVLGSDVHGPMGHELIPFSTRAAAAAFLADHHGQRLVPFVEITKELIDQIRVGNKMKQK